MGKENPNRSAHQLRSMNHSQDSKKKKKNSCHIING